MSEEKRDWVVIATSGSTDYLSDATAGRRFWPVTVSDDGEACDGVHDEAAPVNYLCTRCFPGLCSDDHGQRDDDEDDCRDETHEE